jgi:hypothetical protein
MFIGVAILVISVIFSYYTLQDGTKNGLAAVIGKNFIYGLTSLIGQGRNSSNILQEESQYSLIYLKERTLGR